MPDMSIQVLRRLFTVEEYHSMVRAGILGEDDRVELLVNLEDEAIEVYQTPSPEGYHEMQTLRRGDRLSPSSFPELKLPVEEILS